MSDYIPPELVPNILARLPVDDVIRCTSVCKFWYSLITCPSFASSHLKLSSPNQQPRLLVAYEETGYNRMRHCVHSDSQQFDKITNLPHSFPSYERLIDSLNGLVCISNSVQDKVTLWNPCIRKSFILPKPRGLSSALNPIPYNPRSIIGFGFVASSNDYKILWYYRSITMGHVAEIYELSTGYWRELKLGDCSNVRAASYHGQTHLKGILHWPAHYQEEYYPGFINYICTFDLENEEFGTMMIPSCLHGHSVVFKLSASSESLYLIDDRIHENYWDVWIMKEYGAAESWKKLCTINPDRFGMIKFCNFRYNGDLVYEKSSKTPGVEKVLVLYDCNNNQVRNLEVPANSYVYSVHTYVDNLALLKGPNGAKIDDVSPKIRKRKKMWGSTLFNFAPRSNGRDPERTLK